MKTMPVQEYIELELEEVRKPVDLPKTNDELADRIYQLLTTKKFRKYALSEEYAQYVKDSVKASVAAGEPIKIIFFGGCYKLWRLDESPEADWAELFAYMYYTRWVKPICAIYKPGVWFDFLLDDYNLPRLNNTPEEDVETYRASRNKVLDFIKPYQPKNLRMTHTSTGSLFPSREAFEDAFDQGIKQLADSLPGGLPELSESEKASVALNVRATPEQLADPKWHEKAELVHSGFYIARNSTGYYAPETHKIISFTQPFAPGRPLAVGSSNSTVVKFWVGVGALRVHKDSYRLDILSPKQLEATPFTWEDVQIKGLQGKNFGRIRVVHEG